MNVTYGCYNINNLCPKYVAQSSSSSSSPGTSSTRQLVESDASSSRGISPSDTYDIPSSGVFVELFEGDFDDDDDHVFPPVPRFTNAVTEEFEDSTREFVEVMGGGWSVEDQDQGQGQDKGREQGQGQEQGQEQGQKQGQEGESTQDLNDPHHQYLPHRSLGGGGGGCGGVHTVKANDEVTDDGATASPSHDDGVLSSKAQSSISEYGALLEALADELVSTLSINPFNIDLSQATPILALCGSLAGCILFGALFLMKWDAGDPPRPYDLIIYPFTLIYSLAHPHPLFTPLLIFPYISTPLFTPLPPYLTPNISKPLIDTPFYISLYIPYSNCHRFVAAERSEALNGKHEKTEMMKAIVDAPYDPSLEDYYQYEALMAQGKNGVLDFFDDDMISASRKIKEKPPTSMPNSGQTQNLFRDITGTLRYSYSGGTLYSECLSTKSKVFVEQTTIDEEPDNRPHRDELDELDMRPRSHVKFKPHHNDNNTSGKSLNMSGKSGKSVMTTASSVYQEIDDTAARALAVHFANAVLPDESLSFANHFDGERHVSLFDSFSWSTMMILLENHYMTHFWFGGPSLAKSRCLRFMVSYLHTNRIHE